MSKPGQHNLTGKLSLRRTKAAKCSTWNIVRVDSIPIHRDVGYLIATAGKERGNFGHFYTCRGVGPTITNHLGFNCRDFPILACSPAATHTKRVPLMVGNHRFLAAPDKSHWTTQLPGC